MVGFSAFHSQYYLSIGSIFAFTVKDNKIEETEKDLADLLSPLGEQNILVNSTVIEDENFLHGAKLVIQTLKGGALHPNTLFLTLGSDTRNDDIIQQLIEHAVKHSMGVILLHRHTRVGFGMQQDVNLWLRDKSPNWHLAMLIALQLNLNWGGKINVITATPDKKDEKKLNRFLEDLSDQARLPAMTEFHILIGSFKNVLETAPKADINIFGMGDKLYPDILRSFPESTKSSCLFVGDSGQENALA